MWCWRGHDEPATFAQYGTAFPGMATGCTHPGSSWTPPFEQPFLSLRCIAKQCGRFWFGAGTLGPGLKTKVVLNGQFIGSAGVCVGAVHMVTPQQGVGSAWLAVSLVVISVWLHENEGIPVLEVTI
jgi:hypothetical protein